MMLSVKKVIRNIYHFDLKDCGLINGNEMILTHKGSEFVNAFKKRDLDSGIIVTPGNYGNKGLVYKSTNGGEFYNNPSWVPDIVSFSFNIFGLKKDAFYRVSIVSRNTRAFNRITDTTDDRTLEVTNTEMELLLNSDLTDVFSNKTESFIFKASGEEETLFFRIGKIYINNIIIDEVEILQEEESIEENKTKPAEEIHYEFAAYGIFSLKPNTTNSKYTELLRFGGFGIKLFYDNLSNEYTLERENSDFLQEPFTNINYIVDFNFNKVKSFGIFDNYKVSDISSGISQNTLKQGYIKFRLINNGQSIKYPDDTGRLIITIRKLEA